MRKDRSATRPSNERAVSDVIAFVFVFSIIITSVGLVTVVGFSVLDDLQDDEQATNAVRAFQSLGQNLGNVERGHAPGRSGEVQLGGGALYVRENSAITVNVTFPAREITREMGTLYYDMDDQQTNVTIEGGAVFREDRAGEPIMVAEPNLRCDVGGPGPDMAVVSVVDFTSDDNSQGGSGTVQVIGREQTSQLPISFQEGETSGNTKVNVTIHDSRFEEAWGRYFTENGWTNSDNDNDWQCEAVAPQGLDVYVRYTEIDISFVTG